MSRKIRVGIIGAGWWAANTHVPALRATGEVEITAACRRSPERLKEFADKTGVLQTFTNHEEMLDTAGLDAAVVCSPHGLHYTHVRAALERGLPVLTDKPLAIRTSEAEELIALAEAKGVLLAVFFGHAYDSRFRYLAGEIRRGALGRLAHIGLTSFANPDSLGFFGNATFQENPAEFPILPTQFRADAELGGGGYLQDVGSHCLSAFLIGTGLRVAEVSAVMDRSDIDLRATASLRLTNGAMATVTVIGDMRPPASGYWGFGRFAYTGDAGTCWNDGQTGELWVQRWGEPARAVPADSLPPPTNPDENFIRALRGETELIAPATEAIECVRALEAAYESARAGKTVVVRREP